MVTAVKGRVSLGAALVLAAASGVGAQERITVWHALDQRIGAPVFQEIVKDFEAKYPDIKVDVVYAGNYDQSLEKLQVAWAGGTAPNVVMLEQNDTSVMYFHGALLPLDNFIKGPNGIDLKDFSPALLDAVTYEGKIVAMPYNVSTPLLYFNRDLFRKSGVEPQAPKNWSEILGFSKKIARDTNGDGKNDVFGIDFYASAWIFEAWIGQNGARVLNEAMDRFTFNSPEAVEAMRFTQSLANVHGVAYYSGNGYALFWDGRLGMAERSTAALADNIQKASFDMGVAPLACQRQCYAPLGGGNFALLNTGTPAQKEAAWTFLKYITSTEPLAKYAAATGYMVARRSSFQSATLRPLFVREPRYLITYSQLEVAHPRPKAPVWSEVQKWFSAFHKLQFRENGNVQVALDDMVRRGNQLLDEWWARRRQQGAR